VAALIEAAVASGIAVTSAVAGASAVAVASVVAVAAVVTMAAADPEVLVVVENLYHLAACMKQHSPADIEVKFPSCTAAAGQQDIRWHNKLTAAG